jgi:hypothetical protein
MIGLFAGLHTKERFWLVNFKLIILEEGVCAYINQTKYKE